MRDKRIVVLLDGCAVRREVIQYAVALAERIEAQITLLMLLPNDPGAGPSADTGAVQALEGGGGRPAPAGDAVARGASILRREAEYIETAGIQVRCEVVQGEPRSEFLKFMATNLSFHTAVWGGDPQALRQGPGRPADHWIATVRHELACPLVSPTRKPPTRQEPTKRR